MAGIIPQMTPDLWIEGLNGKVRIMDPPVRELLEFHDKPYQNFDLSSQNWRV